MLSLPSYRASQVIYESPRSRVYRGVTLADDRPVILKTLCADHPTDIELERIRWSFEIGQAMRADGVIAHLALVPHGQALALVTEDIGGVSLRTMMDTRPLGLAEVLRVGIATADALGEIHRHGVIHQDVKPGNIVVNPATGLVKVIDLGSSLDTRRSAQHGSVSPVSALLPGTLRYIAPEQTGRTRHPVDLRADLYALGVTLYELLAGTVPFESNDPLELIHCHVARVPRPLDAVAPRVPAGLSAVVARLLAKSPEDRYQSAHGLRRDLARCLDDLERTGTIIPFTLGLHDTPGTFEIPARLYGRQTETAVLAAALHRAVQGACTVVRVTGSPGSGKTALVDTLRKPTVQAGGLFAAGKFDTGRRDRPYLAVATALRDLVRQCLGHDAAAVESYRAAVTLHLDGTARVLTDLVPELVHLTGEPPALPDVEPAEAVQRFHLAVRRLLRAFTTSTPVVTLFLDDLQWADAASLAVVRQVLLDPVLRHLLVVGAWRDGEVDPSHPLMAILDEVRGVHTDMASVAVTTLDTAAVSDLVADALRCPVDDTTELAAVLVQKTLGNPFFVGQVLRSLHADGSVALDPTRGQWTWDLPRIKANPTTDNVADFMAARLASLEPATRELVTLAAFVGNRVDLTVLATVSARTVEDVRRDLAQALDQGMVVSTGAHGSTVQFVHDRVQQAAQASVPDGARPALHLRIGRLLRQGVTAQPTGGALLDVVNHLDQALDLVTDPAERLSLAALNLAAARAARTVVAHHAAGRYLAAGIALLPATAWQTDRDLALALHTDAVEAAYLDGDFTRMESLAATVLARVDSLVEAAPVQGIRLQSLMARNQLLDAVDQGVTVLKSFGVRLPHRPSPLRALRSIVEARLAVGRQDTTALAALPVMVDPVAMAAMRVLSSVGAASYMSLPAMLPLIVGEQVKLTVRHGRSPLAAYTFCAYGLVLAAGIGNVPAGYAHGRLAMDLLDAEPRASREAATRCIFGAFVQHLREPIRATFETLERAHAVGVATGELEFGVIAAVSHAYALFFAGEPLEAVSQATDRHEAFVTSVGYARFAGDLGRLAQVVANLRQDPSPADPVALQGARFDEATMRETYARTADRSAQACLAVLHVMLAVTFDQHARAVDLATRARTVMDAVGATVFPPAFAFYTALARLRCCDGAPATVRWRHILDARRDLARLRGWARHAPENQMHRVHLVSAELARVRGDIPGAMALYDLAIEAARTHRYVHEEALASEWAGRFYLALNRPRVARDYLRDALYAWRRWGATARVRALEAQHATLLARGLGSVAVHAQLGGPSENASGDDPGSTQGNTTVSTETTVTALDLATAMKASQAISGEIVPRELSRRLLAIAMENAGAQRGVLVLRQDDTLRVEACGTVDAVSVGPPVVLSQSDAVPAQMVSYVARTRELLLVDDPADEGLFTRDPYLQAHRPRAALCVPLVKQAVLFGVLYLENRLTREAFTRDRVEVLQLLAAQAAITLENARLYENLQRLLDVQAQTANAQQRFVPHQFLRALDRTDIRDVAVGDHVEKPMSILFSDIRGFTAHVEQMTPQASIGFINQYFRAMEPPIHAHGGFVDSYIGDAIMALFEDGADTAVRAGVGMLNALHALNAVRAQEGMAPIRVGIGINTGTVMLGTLGGAHQIKCGVVGDAVNVAARMEALTKRYGVSLLVTGDCRAALGDPPGVGLRAIARVQLPGRSAPTTAYEVFEADPAPMRDAKSRMAERFTDALDRYRARDFTGARQGFAACAAACPDDRPAALYVSWCDALLEQPPDADWDGIDRMATKS